MIVLHMPSGAVGRFPDDNHELWVIRWIDLWSKDHAYTKRYEQETGVHIFDLGGES